MIEMVNFMKQINLPELFFLSTFAFGNKCNFYESDKIMSLRGKDI